jgi:hypothetical protein
MHNRAASRPVTGSTSATPPTPTPKKMPSEMVLTLQILRDHLREMKASGNEGNQLVNVFRAIKKNEQQIKTAINEHPSAPELASFRNAYGLFLQRFDALLQEKGVLAVL